MNVNVSSINLDIIIPHHLHQDQAVFQRSQQQAHQLKHLLQREVCLPIYSVLLLLNLLFV